MNELSPIFEIQVWLDGDDYPPTATENVRLPLKRVLSDLLTEKAIRAFNFTERPLEGSHLCLTDEDEWRPCPSSLCEAEALLERLEVLTARLKETTAALKELVTYAGQDPWTQSAPRTGQPLCKAREVLNENQPESST